MAEAEELAKLVDVGELSRDFGLDITVSDGGLVTSALNQRQYRAECGKLYQQFMLSMADYIFEEAQLKKRLQGLMTQKKQPHVGKSAKDESPPQTARGQPAAVNDEDAFTPDQMDEFRRLANSRASNRSPSKARVVGVGVGMVGPLGQAENVRPPTSASFRAPSRAGGARAETPHIFPALKERPLTSMSRGRRESRLGSAATSINKQTTLASAANMYGGRDQEYDGVMDPTADFSVNRRMRMNPCAFSRLSSAGRIKVKVMDKAGEFVMKPVVGKPGVVSINGKQDLEDGGDSYMIKDSRDKMALVKMKTSFKSPTLASELKTNNLVAIQKSLLGQETKRMTVGEVMAKSRDRRARLFRVQMSMGRLDDWDVPGEDRTGRPPTRSASAGGRSLQRGGPSRLGFTTLVPTMPAHQYYQHSLPSPSSPAAQAAKSVVDSVQRGSTARADSPSGRTMMRGRSERESESGNIADAEDDDDYNIDVFRSRAKTAPAARSNRRSTSTPIPEGDGGDGGSSLHVPARRSAARSSSPYNRRGDGVGGGDSGAGGGSRLEVPSKRSARSPSPSSRSRSGGRASAVSSTRSSRRRDPATRYQPPTLSVVQLELKHDAASSAAGPGLAAAANSAGVAPAFPATPRRPGPQRVPGSERGPPSSRARAPSTTSSRAMFPVSAKSLESHAHGAGRAPRPGGGVRSGKDIRRSEDAAEKDCSVQIRHIHTLRDSAAVVRRWKDMDRDREDKLNKWRMRMSFAATRRGNLGKMLSKA